MSIIFNLLTSPFSMLLRPRRKKRLVIFARYPVVGKCKTRLIGAIGAEGAWHTQRGMLLHISKIVRQAKLQSLGNGEQLEVEIYYSKDNEMSHDEVVNSFKSWLGKDFTYSPQPSEGGLGERLLKLINSKMMYEDIVIIASDTPSITVDIINDAFVKLLNNDVVIGPANDGGYYLIGLRKRIKEIAIGAGDIKEIKWSTSNVLDQTIQICKTVGASFTTDLPRLTDIDLPDNLPIWEEEKNKLIKLNEKNLDKISIIIPVLNEEKDIEDTIRSALTGDMMEIIIVDGGSTDGTINIVNKLIYQYKNDHVINLVICEKGRAKQQNYGATIATGSIYLFVHGDTKLPVGYDQMIRYMISKYGNGNKIIAGAFKFEIEDKLNELNYYGTKLIEFVTNLRARYLQMPYGDQCLFITSFQFNEIGGFPSIEFMDDFEIVRKLKKRGKIGIVKVSAVTSGRRWKKLGLIKTTLLNQFIIWGYFLGINPRSLLNWYYGK